MHVPHPDHVRVTHSGPPPETGEGQSGVTREAVQDLTSPHLSAAPSVDSVASSALRAAAALAARQGDRESGTVPLDTLDSHLPSVRGYDLLYNVQAQPRPPGFVVCKGAKICARCSALVCHSPYRAPPG